MPAGRQFLGLKTIGRNLALLGLSFTVDGAGAVSVTNASGAPATVSKTGTGIYRITLGRDTDNPDKYYKLLACVPSIGKATAYGYNVEWKAEDVDGTTPYVDLRVLSAAAGATASTTATNAAMKFTGHAIFNNPIAAELITIVADELMVDGAAATLTGVEPDYPRPLSIRITDADTSISAGTVTVVGTAPDGTAITEDIDISGGGTATYTTTLTYATVTSVTPHTLTGEGTGDNISVGVAAGLGLPIPVGATGVAVTNTYVDGVVEAVAGLDTTGNFIEPTTAANGTHDYQFVYQYTFTPTQAAHTHASTAAVAADPVSARVDVLLLLQCSEVD